MLLIGLEEIQKDRKGIGL
ncbi:hypothetical protein [Paenibacillus macquariensis]